MVKNLGIFAVAVATFLSAGPAATEAAASAPKVPVTHATTTYRYQAVDGIKIFYREAGPKNAPTILFLHGFPSSSRMFDTLIPLLTDRFHLIAPDYPGFGHSDAPPIGKYKYTFANITETMDRFTQALGLKKYSLFVSDYGGPVGFRLAVAHPERVTAIVVQNAVAHNDGLDDKIWAPRRAFWADRAAHEERVRKGLISPEVTRKRHVGNSPHPERYNPDLWTDELAFLNKPGMADIQLELFYDYRTNVEAYPIWQAYLKKHQPPLLVVWGRYDPNFALAEAEAYRRDVTNAEVHILDGGHFALDEAVDDIAAITRAFLLRKAIR